MKVAARLKVMSRLDIAERRIPQDGRIKMKLSKNRVDRLPREHAARRCSARRSCCRVLDPSSAQLGIDALGYEDRPEAAVPQEPREAVRHDPRHGPDRQRQDRVAVHRPQHPQHGRYATSPPPRIRPKSTLPGINQVNVNPKVGLTFASALRAFLRQDPDVIMVGEIRDLETAEIAIKAAQTGHLVLSTLHTNDAPKTLTRLVDMGVKPYAIATSVSLIIAQRLARKLCTNCKKPVDMPPRGAAARKASRRPTSTRA